jgi:AcrR family transcriptional regulator
MTRTKRKVRGRDAALSRDQIVATAIELLDRGGEAGLTFKSLAAQLATGAGAIYGHICNKDDLMIAASDAIISKVASQLGHANPQESIRAFALGMFDAFDAHPWVGAALTHMPGQTPLVRVLDVVGQAIRALGVSPSWEWPAAMAVFNYIIGVGGQNAANAQVARAQNLNRADVLASLARTWSDLNREEYPFAHSIGSQLRTHDDRADFLAGIDFIIAGIIASTARLSSVDASR